MHAVDVYIRVKKRGLCHNIKRGAVVHAHQVQWDSINQVPKSFRVTTPLDLLTPDAPIGEVDMQEGHTWDWVFPDECEVVQGDPSCG